MCPPVDGDSVYIGTGNNIVIDVTTPKLYAIIIDGGGVYAFPNCAQVSTKTIEANYIIIRKGGVFQAGTESNCYCNNLKIQLKGTMTGAEGRQLPLFGNKGIFLQNGRVDLHGCPRKQYTSNLVVNAL